MKIYRTSQAAEYLHVAPQTVRNYCKEGKLEYSLTPGGQRVFSRDQLDALLGKEVEGKTVFYVRDSGGSQAMMDAQVEKLTEIYGPPAKIYKDKASGLNEKRPGLKTLIKDARLGKYNTLAITNKDRLTRFGYSYLEDLLSESGIKIVLLEPDKELSPHDELIQDFMSLIASFSGKFYKMRGLEQRRMLLERAERELA